MGAPRWDFDGQAKQRARFLGECLRAAGDYDQGRAVFSQQQGIPLISDGAARSLLRSYGQEPPSWWLTGQVRGRVGEETADRAYVDREAERPTLGNYGHGGLESVFLLPDAHIPEEDPVAFPLAIQSIEQEKPDTVTILGDWVDMESMSSHGKRPERMDHYADEIKAGNSALDKVDAVHRGKKIFCLGNHEDRVRRYVADRAPELHGELDIVKSLNLVERGWQVVPYGGFTHIGKLMVTHDVDHCGLTAAARSITEIDGNIAFGHSHNATTVYRGDVFGVTRVGMSCGWLGRPGNIIYMKRHKVARNWQHGTGRAFVERDTGVAHCHFVPIIKRSSGGSAVTAGGQLLQMVAA